MKAALAALYLILGPLDATVVSVHDGDTFTAHVYTWPGEVKETNVRVLGIDAPEMHGACPDAAKKARDRLADLLSHGRITLKNIRPDKYGGRVEAYVYVEGVPVDETLVKENLVHPYGGGTRKEWCP